jgi:hypothetical protein
MRIQLNQVVRELVELREADLESAAARDLARDLEIAQLLRRLDALEARPWWRRLFASACT